MTMRDDLRRPADAARSTPAASTQARHLMIRASAGSGKTYQLVLRYLRTLLDGVPAERILVSTFTRKAAGEILGRILGMLAKAARNPDALRRLADHLGAADFDRAACLASLRELTSVLHRLRVSTLDSFFARLATSYTLELGLPPGWEMIEDLDDTRLRSQAVDLVLSNGDVSDARRLTNLLSKGDAARSVSGKIRETVDSYYGIFQQTQRPAWERFPKLFPLSSEMLAASKDELRTVPLPDLKSYQKAREGDYQNALGDDWECFISRGIPASLLSGRRTYGNCKQEFPEQACIVYQRLIDHAVAVIVNELARRTAAAYELLEKFDGVYARLKREARQLRFEDVTNRLAGAFNEEHLGQLAYRLDGDVEHLLLDEFQDTSMPQWSVLRPFARRIVDAGKGTSFFCVGDVKQAIYGWRGGVAEIFDAVDTELDRIETQPLLESRRSSPPVIDTVNRLFKGLSRHDNLGDDAEAVERWSDAFDEHRTALDIPGHVTVEAGPAEEDPDGETPKELALEHAAARVAAMTDAAPDVTIGLLTRTNRDVSALMYELRKRKVDASEEGGNPLVDSAAVQVILSLVRLADHPGDTISRFHIATSPLGPVLEFRNDADDASAWRLSAMLRRQLNDAGYGATVDRWVQPLLPHCSRRDELRLGQLVELAYRYEEQSTLRPTRFLQFVECTKVDDPSPAKVRVMSVHQAKGLQFDVVVLPLVDSRLVSHPPDYVAGEPSPSAPPDRVSLYANSSIQSLLPVDMREMFKAAQAAKIREELCILYVAVTRAAHALHIIVPASSETERRLPKSFAGMVRAALTDGQPARPLSVLYEHGDPQWPTRREAASAAAAADAPSAAAPEPSPLIVKLGEITGVRRRGLGRVAPSQAGVAERVRVSQLVPGGDSIALNRGTLMHAWFEQIEWLDAAPPDEDHLRSVARRLGFSPTAADRHLREFREMLSRPAVAEILSQQSYRSLHHPPLPPAIAKELAAAAFELEVDRESRVAALLEGDLLTGAIDRLVLLRSAGRVAAADVIDFKSDAVGPKGATALPRTNHYRRQLQSYAAAVALMYQLPPQRITARLVFVEPGEIVTIR